MSFLKKIKNAIVPAGTGAAAGFALAGPVGAAIGGLAGAGMSYMSDTQADKQNKLAQASIDRANAYDLRMWNLANTYNDPKMQMQRLADAGLNPNLVYGGGNVTGNTTSAPGSNGSADTYVADKVGNSVQAAQMLANLSSTRLSNKVQESTLNQMPIRFAHEMALKDIQAQIMQHNLTWAEKHGMPVGAVPDWDTGLGALGNEIVTYGRNKILG